MYTRVESEALPAVVPAASSSAAASASSASADRKFLLAGIVVVTLTMLVLGGIVTWLALAMRDLAPAAQRANAVLSVLDTQLARTNGDVLSVLVGARTAEGARAIVEKAASFSFTIFPSNVVNVFRHFITYNYPGVASQVITMASMVNKTLYAYGSMIDPYGYSLPYISSSIGEVISVAQRIAALTPLTPVTVTDFGFLDLYFGMSPLDWISSQIAPTSYKALGQSCVALMSQVQSTSWSGTYTCSTGTCQWNFQQYVNEALQYMSPGCTTLANYPL